MHNDMAAVVKQSHLLEQGAQQRCGRVAVRPHRAAIDHAGTQAADAQAPFVRQGFYLAVDGRRGVCNGGLHSRCLPHKTSQCRVS